MKITEYSSVSKLTKTNVMLLDGPEGTKIISGSDLPFAIMDLCGPEMHRMVYRGKNLGTNVTVDQKAAIQNGTFEDLWLGDYWEISDVKWRIVDFDYWYRCGDTEFTSHHVVVMPDAHLYTAKMNDTSTTTGGYTGSSMYTTGLTQAKTVITQAFGSNVLSHRDYLINAVTSGYPSAGAWTDSTVELPNEVMIYGSYIYTPAGNGTIDVKRYTNNRTQLALFAVCPKFINANPDGERISYWLRDVASATAFVRVASYGPSTNTAASTEYGVRPVFAIG